MPYFSPSLTPALVWEQREHDNIPFCFQSLGNDHSMYIIPEFFLFQSKQFEFLCKILVEYSVLCYNWAEYFNLDLEETNVILTASFRLLHSKKSLRRKGPSPWRNYPLPTVHSGISAGGDVG